MSTVENNISNMGLGLPQAAKPVANYVSYLREGNLLYVSGQICTGADGHLADAYRGKLGGEISAEAGKDAARLCALNILAQVKAAVGDLDDPRLRCVRLGGFINAVPTFAGIAGVMNGASDLIVEALGERRGRHTRSTIGVAELPMDAAVEVEAIFAVA